MPEDEDADLSITDTSAEAGLWVRLILTIPVTPGGAVAQGNTRIFMACQKGKPKHLFKTLNVSYFSWKLFPIFLSTTLYCFPHHRPDCFPSKAYFFSLSIHLIYIVCSNFFSGLSALKKKKKKGNSPWHSRSSLHLALDQNFPFYPYKHSIQIAKGV